MSYISDLFRKILDSRDFVPRWVCGNWSEIHGWIYIVSSLSIWAAYFTIPVLLIFFINKRKGFLFKPVLVWFILFIFFCGTTHLVDTIIFWIPIYRINAILLFFTAIVSWATIFVLYKYLPIAMDYKSPEQLKLIIDLQTNELTLAYQKLAESEKQFKVLVNNNPDVITRIGKDLKYKFINDTIFNLRNIKPEDIIGKSMMELTDDNNDNNNNIQLFVDNVRATLNTGVSHHFEFSTHTTSYQKGYFWLNVIPLFNEHTGSVDDVLTVTKDITQQKLNEIVLNQNIINLKMLAEKLENKRKILEDFTYIVSHNLRSPVANLSSLLQLIEQETDSEAREMWIQKVIEAFEKLSSTVTDLTSVVQIRQNTGIAKQVLRFEDILKNHLTGIETQIAEANAEILYHFSKVETIEYSKIYLESIILNLLTNAIKYRSTQRKPKIIFTSSIDKDGVVTLTCEDNGLGIDLKKHGNKIFGLNKTFHDHPDSKGIGLFITKNQIETMGGSIFVDSEVDKGTKFIISFNNYDIVWKEK